MKYTIIYINTRHGPNYVKPWKNMENTCKKHPFFGVFEGLIRGLSGLQKCTKSDQKMDKNDKK